MVSGQYIKEIRLQGMMSQMEFAQALEVSFATVNRWENGKCAPSYEALRRLKKYCELYNLSFEMKKIMASEEDGNE